MKNLADFVWRGTLPSIDPQRSFFRLKTRMLPRTQSTLVKTNQAVIKFLVPLTLEETYKTIVKEIVQIIRGKSGSIFLKRKNGLERVYSSRVELKQVRTRRKGLTYRAYKNKQVSFINDEDLWAVHPEMQKMGVRSVIFIPLSYQNRASGVLTVQSNKIHRWTQEEIDFFKLLGSMASLAIRKAQLHEKAEEALVIRDKFLSLAGHELKTPLTTINGYIQLLQKKNQLKAPSSESEWIQQLVNETHRLTNLVNEILEVNKVRSGKIELALHEFHLAEVLEKSIRQFEEVYPTRNLIFEKKLATPDEDLIIADDERLRRVFISLFDNAVKFSPDTSPISIRLQATKHFVSVIIRDKGRGIKPESIPYLFDDFHKENTENTEKGMGFGLYLVKKIISAHQGQVTLTSRLGKGTAVRVKLPKVEYV
jgi:signal transduction histidine kinase